MNRDVEDLTMDTADEEVDDRGVPLSAEYARIMTDADLTHAVLDVIADLEATSYEEVRTWETADDGSVAIDSHLAVVVFNEFTGHLSAHNIDLADVPQEKWTSVAGVVEVILAAYSGIAGPGNSQ